MISASYIIGWILKHPRYRELFPGWDRQQIAHYVCVRVNDNEIFVAVESGILCGIICAIPYHDEQIIRVETLLTTSSHALPIFAQAFFELYPNYTVIANGRRGRRKLIKFTHRNLARLRHKCFKQNERAETATV